MDRRFRGFIAGFAPDAAAQGPAGTSAETTRGVSLPQGEGNPSERARYGCIARAVGSVTFRRLGQYGQRGGCAGLGRGARGKRWRCSRAEQNSSACCWLLRDFGFSGLASGLAHLWSEKLEKNASSFTTSASPPPYSCTLVRTFISAGETSRTTPFRDETRTWADVR